MKNVQPSKYLFCKENDLTDGMVIGGNSDATTMILCHLGMNSNKVWDGIGRTGNDLAEAAPWNLSPEEGRGPWWPVEERLG